MYEDILIGSKGCTDEFKGFPEVEHHGLDVVVFDWELQPPLNELTMTWREAKLPTG